MSRDDIDALPDRAAILRGMPEKRAATALFLIESRTAYLADRSRRDADGAYVAAEEGREADFLQAFTLGRAPRVSVTVQQLEQWSPSWAGLVPDLPQARAALAHRLGEKYAFAQAAVPGIRRAAGLDDLPVADAYHRFYGVPISTIYAPGIALRDRPGWLWQRLASRLENLHPFWLAFALTLPVGPGLMALPIALAGVGPLLAVALVALFALINMATAAALAEAVARSGITRYGQGYLGQLAGDWLGRTGSVFMTLAFTVDGVLILPVFYLGIATTLAAATGVATPIWVAAIFGIGLYFLSRRTLNTTVASTVVIIAVDVALLLTIPLFAVPYVAMSGLTRAPLVGLGAIQLIFGVMLSNYFSHQLIANYGRVVLRRDPDARSWIRGSVAAIAATAVISAFWILAVDGSLSPDVLQHDRGTVVVVLGKYISPVTSILGSALVILSLGMTTIHISLGVMFTTKERLPLRIRRDPRLGAALSILPVALIFLITEWLAVSGVVSFASLLGFVTVMTLTTLGAFFPILLVLAGRRKSDSILPGMGGPLGSPAVLAPLYGVFLAVVFAYGLFVWTTPLQRGVTLLAALAITAGTVIVFRQGMLNRRVVVEIRDDEGTRAPPLFTLIEGGRPLDGTITIENGRGEERTQGSSGPLPPIPQLQMIRFELPETDATEIKIWAHRVTSIGESVSLPAVATLGEGAEARVADLSLSDGWAVLPLVPGPVRVAISLARVSDPARSMDPTFVE